jgi:hypothetical protein
MNTAPNSGNTRTAFNAFEAARMSGENSTEKAKFIAHLITRGLWLTPIVPTQIAEIWDCTLKDVRLIEKLAREEFCAPADDETDLARVALNTLRSVYADAMMSHADCKARHLHREGAAYLAVALNAAKSIHGTTVKPSEGSGAELVFRVEGVPPERPTRSG